MKKLCTHTQTHTEFTGSPQTRTPIHRGSPTELQMHTPAHNTPTPRLSVLPHVSRLSRDLVGAPASSSGVYLPTQGPPSTVRGESALHGPCAGAEGQLCASLSSGVPFPNPPSAHQSQPFLGVRGVRSDSVFLQQRLLAACQAQAAVASLSDYRVSIGVSVDVVTWLSAQGWFLLEKMPISRCLP